MKKLLLSMGFAALAFSASADKVVFIADGSQDFYNGDAQTKIVKLIGQPVGEETPLMGNFGSIAFSNAAIRVSCFRMSKSAASKLIVTPLEGITINKIVIRQQNQDAANTANCNQIIGSEYNVDEQTQTLSNISNATTFSLTDAVNELRISWIEVDYTGTPTQVEPVMFNSEYPLLPKDKKVVLSCSTPNATIEYSLNNTDWSTYNSDGIPVDADCTIYTRATKEGLAASPVNACKFYSIPAGLKKVTYDFNTWATMPINPATDKPFSKAELITEEASAGSDPVTVNSFIALTEGDTFLPIALKKDDVSLSFSKANARIFYSKTQGFAVNVRYYNKNVITAEVPDGCSIERILYFGDLTNLAVTDTKNVKGSSISSGSLNKLRGDNYNFIWLPADESPTTKVVFTAGKTLQSGAFANFTGYLSNMHVFYRPDIENSVSDLNADENAPVEYFNLQGVKVANPEGGVFIRRQGSSVTKVVK